MIRRERIFPGDKGGWIGGYGDKGGEDIGKSS